ncbi:MAG: hypothetical protein B0D92_04010 [Spirochaeta sp. LUC14_002_19_P3]|nr:MAG: hypothetical protein B0D92_04010 [Spirochaeta sp. LUC14_002_19_P3]
MTKTERIDAVLKHQQPDRAPISCWYHFGVQFMPGEKFAEIVLAFFRHFDFDWLKVMNDYYYPMPDGMLELKSPADLRKLKPFRIDDSPWGEQLKALSIIAEALEGKAYFCDTIFDPWQVLQRSPVGEHLPHLIADYPDDLLAALDVVTDMVSEYARRVMASGTHGIFMSSLAGRSEMSREHFLAFVKPFAMRVFEAVKDSGPMNTAHLHGKDIDIENCLDFPVSILSWEDRLPGNPSLREVKKKWPGCVMGGIDHTILTRHTPRYIVEHTRQGMALGGQERFFLANGCSTPGHMDLDALKAVVQTAQGVRL